MITEQDLVTILNDEIGEVSMDKEVLDDIPTSPDRIEAKTGRVHRIITRVFPDPNGGLRRLEETVIFAPKSS